MIERGALSAVEGKCSVILDEIDHIQEGFIVTPYVFSDERQPMRQELHPELQNLRAVTLTYLARVHHLTAAVDRSAQMMNAILRHEAEPLTDHALSAWRYRVLADLLQLAGHTDDAVRTAKMAVAEASSSGMFNVEAETRLATDSILGLRRPNPKYFANLDDIEERSRLHGLAKVQCSCLIARAVSEMGVGSFRSARNSLFDALAIASSNGLRLRKVEALRLLAVTMIEHDTSPSRIHEGHELAAFVQAESDRIGLKIDQLEHARYTGPYQVDSA